MQKRSAKFVAPLAVVSAAVLAVSSGLASASGTATGRSVRAYEADTNLAGSRGTVVLAGAITDSGIDHQGAGPNGSNQLVLSKGSFAVDVSEVGNELGNLPVDQTTCSSDGTVTGPITIVPGTGTGAYQGSPARSTYMSARHSFCREQQTARATRTRSDTRAS